MLEQNLKFPLPLGNAYTKKNARSKLKDFVNNAVDLRTQFEVYLAMTVVEHKRPEFLSGETFMECNKDANELHLD
jgi:hypothetical protein